MSDLESAASDVETTKPVHNARRKLVTASLIVISIPLVVVVAGIVTTWWRPVTLLMLCPALKAMGYSKMAEPMALRAVELYAHSDGLNSKQTMLALWNLGQIYVDNDKPAKAEQVFRALAIYNAKKPKEGPVAPYQVLRAWSKTLRTLGRTKDAERVESQLEQTSAKSQTKKQTKSRPTTK